MHCSHCGAILSGESAYCGSCGTLIEPQLAPERANLESAQPVNTLLVSALSSEKTAGQLPPALSPSLPPEPPLFSVDPTRIASSASPSMESGWAEFSNTQVPFHASAPVPSGVYPPLPVPAAAYAPGYMVPGAYPGYVPNLMPPGVAQPAIMQVPQKPRRRWPLFVLGMIVGMLITLVFGGVIVGLRARQTSSSPNGATTVAASTPTSVATSSVDANLLYQQVTSQTPTIVDSLQDATLSQWKVFEEPKYGCEVKSDGLHVHIKDLNHFTYCTYGGSAFGNFAGQVEMKMLTGNGGGLTFRGDSEFGNLYYFHVYRDGSYTLYIEQNHKLTTKLGGGFINSFVANGKNTLTVIAKDSQLYLYVNQQSLIHFQDATYTIGYFGLIANALNAPAEVVYTNAKIWKL